MKIGPRITLATTALVAVSVGVYGILAVRARRAELERDLERQTLALALAIAGAVEAGADTGPTTSTAIARRLGASLEIITFDEYANPDVRADTRERARRVQIQGNAVAELLPASGARPPSLALAFPIRRGDRIVGVLELSRDASHIEETMHETVVHMITVLGLLVLGLALAVVFIARTTITRPLRRMLQEISEVAKGDLTRTVFAARSDEVGQFAARFNEMTASLREARAETERGIETRLALEARLRQSEKLATIGQLAAEIAHEVGTPLNVIGGRARSMEKKANDPEEVARNASIIAAQASRISKIIQRLLDFARRRAPMRTEVDLNRVVAEAIEFLEHEIERARVRVERTAGDGVDRIPGDPDAIQQVCLNLIVNGVQAMPGGGTLHVSTAPVLRRKEGLETAPPSLYACLEVSDSGVGISAEERAKMFEPFYSTKEDGTGLGLAVSQGIVKDHDGWIEIEPRAEGGTTFRVFLPAAAESSTAAKSA